VRGAADRDVAGHVAAGDRERRAQQQVDRGRRERGEADLGPLQVGEDADGATGEVRRRAHHRVRVLVVGMAAVGEVEAGDVHAGVPPALDALLVTSPGPRVQPIFALRNAPPRVQTTALDSRFDRLLAS
jgi:hypothetical protein